MDSEVELLTREEMRRIDTEETRSLRAVAGYRLMDDMLNEDFWRKPDVTIRRSLHRIPKDLISINEAQTIPGSFDER
jgi:hypothetical protein